MTETTPVERILVPIQEGKGLVPADFDGLYRICNLLASSDIVPVSCIGKPANIFVRAQFGMELGMGLMASIQNVSNINGNPAVWGDAPLGIVKASGQLESFKEEEVGKYPDKDYAWKCTVKRKGESDPAIRTFSIDDAIIAGSWCRPPHSQPSDKQKYTPWYRYPKRMLQMRARSWALRDTFPDFLKGIRIGEEYDQEVELVQQPDGRYAAPQADPIKDKTLSKIDALKEKMKSEPEKKDNGKYGHMMSQADKDMGKAKADDMPSDLQITADRVDAIDNKKQDFRSEWINLRTSGFATYVYENLKRFDGSEHEKEAIDKWNKLYPGESWPLTPPDENIPEPENVIVPGDESEAFLKDEYLDTPTPESAAPKSNGNGESKIFHDMDEIVAMPKTLQRVYVELAETADMDSIYISPKAVNQTLKRRYPAQWESARNQLGFGFIPVTDHAADLWNDAIIELVDAGMKV